MKTFSALIFAMVIFSSKAKWIDEITGDCKTSVYVLLPLLGQSSAGVTACPAGMQDKIDTVYSDCADSKDWNTKNDNGDSAESGLTEAVEQFQCSSGMATKPTFLLVAGISFLTFFFGKN